MEIALTQTVTKGGCAAKLPAGELSKLLQKLDPPTHPQLLVGAKAFDDASLLDLQDGRYLISTLDFFTPIVDSPEDFGAIAAANALSDIYAMGGEPALALTILAFPMAQLSLEVLERCLFGAHQKICESGAGLGGGHSIDDETLKLGFCINGFVEKGKEWIHSGVKAGDALILTKGLGTGTIATAIKSQRAKPHWIEEAISSMKLLNTIPKLLQKEKVHAATDVTGFGLAGHALHLARSSNVTLEIEVSKLPLLEGALQSLEEGNLNRAHRTNLEYVEKSAKFDAELSKTQKLLTVDAQTSGGLLLSVASEDATKTIEKLQPMFPKSQMIGRAISFEGHHLDFSKGTS